MPDDATEDVALNFGEDDFGERKKQRLRFVHKERSEIIQSNKKKQTFKHSHEWYSCMLYIEYVCAEVHVSVCVL